MVIVIESRDQRKEEKQQKSIRTKGFKASDKKLCEFKSNIILFLTKRGFDKQKKEKSFHSTHAIHYKNRGGCVPMMHRKSSLLKVALTDGEMT